MLLRLRGLSVGMRVVRFCFSFCCLYAARQECALSFSFALSFLGFICVLRLCAIPLLMWSIVILSWWMRHGFFLFFPLRIRFIFACTCRHAYVQPPGLSYRVYDIVYPASGLCVVNILWQEYCFWLHYDIQVGTESQGLSVRLYFFELLLTCSSMLVRAASGLIISCIQPPGFEGVPFMVWIMF